MTTTRRPGRERGRAHGCAGFTIVELLVAVGIAMALTLAITLMMVRHDESKRTTVASNDTQLTATYLGYELDRILRSAGSGLTSGWRANFGCLVRSARAGTQILPRATAFPAPFATVPTAVRLAPVIIHGGAGADGTDVLAVATGASGLGEASMRVLPGSITATSLRVPSTIGMRSSDLVLVSEGNVGCMVQQVTSPFAGGAVQQINFAGTYAASVVGGLNLTDFGSTGQTQASALGNVAGNTPAFQLIGRATGDTLVSYDLLRLAGTDTPVALAEGVVELRARYGVDTNLDGRIDTWVLPTAAGYTPAELNDGSAAAQQRLLTILAVRVGLILRSDRVERNAVAPASMTLFTDLAAALQVTRTISATEQRQRHRALELTVPLRNLIHAART